MLRVHGGTERRSYYPVYEATDSEQSQVYAAQKRIVQLTACVLLAFTLYCYMHGFLTGEATDLPGAFRWALAEWSVWLVGAPIVAALVFRLGRTETDPGKLFLRAVGYGTLVIAAVLALRGVIELALRELSIPALLFYHLPVDAIALVATTAVSIWWWWRSRPLAAPSKSPDATFTVWSPRGARVLGADEIDFATASGNYVEVVAAGRTYLLRSTMKELASQLAGTQLVRTHRSYFVNLAKARDMKHRASGNHVLIMDDGVRIPVSKSFRNAVRAALRNQGCTG